MTADKMHAAIVTMSLLHKMTAHYRHFPGRIKGRINDDSLKTSNRTAWMIYPLSHKVGLMGILCRCIDAHMNFFSIQVKGCSPFSGESLFADWSEAAQRYKRWCGFATLT
jgi:hypothetical protein